MMIWKFYLTALVLFISCIRSFALALYHFSPCIRFLTTSWHYLYLSSLSPFTFGLLCCCSRFDSRFSLVEFVNVGNDNGNGPLKRYAFDIWNWLRILKNTSNLKKCAWLLEFASFCTASGCLCVFVYVPESIHSLHFTPIILHRIESSYRLN